MRRFTPPRKRTNPSVEQEEKEPRKKQEIDLDSIDLKSFIERSAYFADYAYTHADMSLYYSRRIGKKDPFAAALMEQFDSSPQIEFEAQNPYYQRVFESAERAWKGTLNEYFSSLTTKKADLEEELNKTTDLKMKIRFKIQLTQLEKNIDIITFLRTFRGTTSYELPIQLQQNTPFDYPLNREERENNIESFKFEIIRWNKYFAVEKAFWAYLLDYPPKQSVQIRIRPEEKFLITNPFLFACPANCKTLFLTFSSLERIQIRIEKRKEEITLTKNDVFILIHQILPYIQAIDFQVQITSHSPNWIDSEIDSTLESLRNIGIKANLSPVVVVQKSEESKTKMNITVRQHLSAFRFPLILPILGTPYVPAKRRLMTKGRIKAIFEIWTWYDFLNSTTVTWETLEQTATRFTKVCGRSESGIGATWIAQTLKDRALDLWVVVTNATWNNDTPLSLAGVALTKHLEQQTDVLLLCSDAVYKDLGIGSFLLDFLVDQAKEKRDRWIFLDAVETAIGFYEKQKFRKRSELSSSEASTIQGEGINEAAGPLTRMFKSL